MEALIELYQGTPSVCAQKARLTLVEKGLEWESRLMALNGDQLAPGYLKLNPYGEVPTLVRDGNVIRRLRLDIFYPACPGGRHFFGGRRKRLRKAEANRRPMKMLKERR